MLWKNNSNTIRTRTISPITQFFIGSPSVDFGVYPGRLDDVRIYNGELSPADVQTLYASFPASSGPTIKAMTPTAGSLAGGTSVTITGKNLANPTSVTFGGIAATIVSSTATQIVAKTPAHAAGVVPMTVTTASGSVTTTDAFTYIIQPQLVAWWKCDEGGGSMVADSAGTNTGTITSANWSAGRVGKALTFNGTTSRVTVPSPSLGLSNQVSIAFWAYGRTETPVASTALYANDAAGNRVMNISLPWSDGTVYWDAGNSGTASYDRLYKATTSVGEYKGQWNHWVFTKNATAGTMAIYLNGMLWATNTTTRTRTLSPISSLYIGSPGVDYGVFPGLLDDVRIYKGELVPAEVQALYTSSPPYSGPVITAVAANPGPTSGGWEVIVSGINFSNLIDVTIGGVKATIISSGATQLVANAPAHAAGIVDVTVTTASGLVTLIGCVTYTGLPVIANIDPAAGSTQGGGWTITINGTNFDDLIDVTFGGVKAMVIDSGAAHITVVIPAHAAGMVDVTVTTASGMVTLSNGFTYIEPPVITSVDPRTGPMHGGTMVTITGMNLDHLLYVKMRYEPVTVVSHTAMQIVFITA